MTTLFTDNFTRANSSTLGSNWTTVTGLAALQILSNEGAAQTGGDGEYNNSNTYPNNQWAQITVGSVVETVTDNGIGPAVRCSTSAETMYFAQTNTHETKLYKLVAGAFTQLGSNGAACATGDTLYIEAQGTSILVKKNGTTIVGPITDSAISSGKAGLWGAANAKFGSASLFTAGDFNAAPPGQGTLTLAGLAPSLALTMATAVGSAAFTGQAPTVTVASARTITPGSGSLNFTGASANQAIVATSGVGSGSWQGYIPQVSISGGGNALTPAEADMAFTGYVVSQILTLPAMNPGAAAFQGYAPALSLGQQITPNPGSLSWTGLVPTQGLPTTPGALSWQGYAPQLVANQIVVPSPGSLTGVGLAVTIAGQKIITPSTGSLSWSGQAATASETTLQPSGSLSFQGYAPRLSIPLPSIVCAGGTFDTLTPMPGLML